MEASTAPERTDTPPEPVPNKWCIIRGTPGTTPLTIVGPFDTAEEAETYETRDATEAGVPATVDALIAPANC